MEIGPFKIEEAEKIQELLLLKKVECEVLVDEDQQDQLAKNAKIIYISFSDDEFHKVKEGLERFGIVAPSDGSWELGED